MAKRAIYWIASSTTLFGFWLLLVSKLEWHETLVGIGAAFLGAVGAEIVRRREHPRFWPHARWVLEAWRIPGSVLRGYWVLMRVLWRREAGVFETARFEARGGNPRSVARRALVITFTSITPDSIIVDIDPRDGFMLVHMAENEQLPEIARILGAHE